MSTTCWGAAPDWPDMGTSPADWASSRVSPFRSWRVSPDQTSRTSGLAASVTARAAPWFAAPARGRMMSAPRDMKSEVAARTWSASCAYVPSLVAVFQPRTLMEVPLARL